MSSQEGQTADNDTGSSISGQSAALSMRSTMVRPAPSLLTGKSRGSMAVRVSTAGSSTDNNIQFRTASMASSLAGTMPVQHLRSEKVVATKPVLSCKPASSQMLAVSCLSWTLPEGQACHLLRKACQQIRVNGCNRASFTNVCCGRPACC